MVEGLDAGADDYISKRATKSEVLARLLVGRRIVGLDQALRQAILKNQQPADIYPLTGTSNRHCLVGVLEQDLVRSRQHGHWVSVLMCDLDDFRQFNDHWGHVIGNEALQEFVARVRGLLGEAAAWIGRYGGDEFVIVLPETPIERACREAELIKHALTTTPLVYSAGALPLTVSIGVTGRDRAHRQGCSGVQCAVGDEHGFHGNVNRFPRSRTVESVSWRGVYDRGE